MKQPKIIPTDRNTFILLEDYVYKDIIVPKGYETNGADIPRLFWGINPPFKPKYMAAIVVHDYLSEIGYWDFGDNIFEEMLNKIDKGLVTWCMAKVVKCHTYYWKLKIKYITLFSTFYSLA